MIDEVVAPQRQADEAREQLPEGLPLGLANGDVEVVDALDVPLEVEVLDDIVRAPEDAATAPR